MLDSIRWIDNQMPKDNDAYTHLMDEKTISLVRHFHESFPQYQPTPLVSLPKMAEYLGLHSLYVKDESYRFGLNAFKVLGGCYAMGNCIAEKIGRKISETDYTCLTGEEIRKELGQMTFFTATDGNHGRGVAWAARILGQKAVIRMPKGTAEARLMNIRREGAEVSIEEINYDDCVRLAATQAKSCSHGVVIQDTAWPGYEQIPIWIMQGYGTMVAEAMEQMGGEIPTHVFIQAGVGSLAGAVIGYFSRKYGKNAPIMIVVEADAADCHYRSALALDGNPRFVKDEMFTMMAGLACGEPNSISFSILKNHADGFVSCPDWVSSLGMRLLAAPIKGDKPVTSGESGAVCMGLVYALMMKKCESLRRFLNLDIHSRVLIFSTEGDTDPENYHRVVWNLNDRMHS